MRVAIAGCGNISRVHIAALGKNPLAQIVAVADIKKERADEKAAQTGSKAYYDFDEMLQNETFDVLHICTPHYLHTPMALKALEKGINVFIEKPCSVSFEETEKLIEAQKKSEKQVAVCFQNRYNACVRRAKAAIDSGDYGKVKCIRAFVTWNRGADYYSDDWHGTLEKECGGVLINQAIHTVDLVQYLGGECEELVAHISNDHLEGVIEVEDTACINMKLRDGVNAILYATTAYGENAGVLVDIVMESGTLRLEGERLYSVRQDGSVEEIVVEISKSFPGQKYWGSGHEALINDFYDCINSNRQFSIDSLEGSKAAKIVVGSYESSNKQIPVKIK